MAKRVRLSDDNGASWGTLPGNTASLSNEAGAIPDTIFGQDFESTQTGLIGWSISANGLYRGFAGYVATLKKTGTPTALSSEPMSLVSGKTYEVTNAAKRLFDRNTAIVINDNGSPVAANNIESIDYLFGRVTFTSGYSPVTPITVASGNYLPLAGIGRANGFTLTQTANGLDDTDYDRAQANDGHRTYIYGLKTVSLEVTGIYAATNDFVNLLRSRAEMVIEVNPDGNGKSVARGFFKPGEQGQEGDVGDLETETITFNLSVPDDEDIALPFKWLHANDTTLNASVRKAITAWEQSNHIAVSYLPDGVNGMAGYAIVTDITLSSGLEAMNEFTVDLQGSDKPSSFPVSTPSGYSVAFGADYYNNDTKDSASFTISGGVHGYSYSWSISSAGGGTPVTGSGVFTGTTALVEGVDLTGLADGLCTVSVTVSWLGATGGAATDTATKDIVAPTGYSIAFVTDPIENGVSDNDVDVTISSTVSGDDYVITFTSSGGGDPIIEDGTAGGTSVVLEGIDLSTLPDGTITASVVMTDPAGNAGTAATDTVTKAAP